MLHILLFVLKIIGFLLLGILGLLLGLVLLVLLVPVRYRVDGSYYGKPKGTVRVTWLLHMLSVLVSYEEELQIVLKIFGFRLFRDKGNLADEAMDEIDEVTEPQWDKTEQTSGEEQEVFEKKLTDPMLEEQKKTTKRKSVSPKKQQEAPKKKGLLEKIKCLFESIYDKLRQVGDLRERLLKFIQNPDNQGTGKLILRQMKSLLRHVLPQKAMGTVAFGFDDPYTTGQVLSVASILYAWYGDKVSITPVFDESVLEGELKLKGRIRIGTILVLGIRILMNKNFRILVKRWRSKGGFLDG